MSSNTTRDGVLAGDSGFFRVECSWCGAVLREEKVEGPGQVSHGICGGCSSRILGELTMPRHTPKKQAAMARALEKRWEADGTARRDAEREWVARELAAEWQGE